MKYIYKCIKCLVEHEIEKPMSESSKKEFCKNCDNLDEMDRVYTAPSTKTSDGFKK